MGVDLVVDTRETWKEFASRVWNFNSAPLVERAELPPEKQPHKSLYGKLSCYINGINPYPSNNTSTIELIVDKENKNDATSIPITTDKNFEEEEKGIAISKVQETVEKNSGRKIFPKPQKHKAEYIEAKLQEEEETNKQS